MTPDRNKKGKKSSKNKVWLLIYHCLYFFIHSLEKSEKKKCDNSGGL